MDTPQGTFYRVYFDIYLTLDGTEFNAELVCQGEVMGRCSARFRWLRFPFGPRSFLFKSFLLFKIPFSENGKTAQKPYQYQTHTCEQDDDDKKTNGQCFGGVWRAFGEEAEEGSYAARGRRKNTREQVGKEASLFWVRNAAECLICFFLFLFFFLHQSKVVSVFFLLPLFGHFFVSLLVQWGLDLVFLLLSEISIVPK